MKLTELKTYLLTHQYATAVDIAHHFDTSPNVVLAMLGHWIRKGKVHRSTATPCSKGCCHASPEQRVIYQWVTEEEK